MSEGSKLFFTDSYQPIAHAIGFSPGPAGENGCLLLDSLDVPSTSIEYRPPHPLGIYGLGLGIPDYAGYDPVSAVEPSLAQRSTESQVRLFGRGVMKQLSEDVRDELFVEALRQGKIRLIPLLANEDVYS
ncbi:Uu.00g010450.m01.CDS01 [Anthostomella pinea]|uniref:Uu.00g010450.m01.CDS01 n=1 Tax=Anthostomella pinea TaxID=933095 RepID=A0AAI8VRT9_9PEZI|nr:Uu.00g010450.m01.CDS01 [Anthostomella pinea]